MEIVSMRYEACWNSAFQEMCAANVVSKCGKHIVANRSHGVSNQILSGVLVSYLEYCHDLCPLCPLAYYNTFYHIVACHLPRAPSYGGVRTWVEGPQMRGDQYDTNSNKITNNNMKYMPY